MTTDLLQFSSCMEPMFDVIVRSDHRWAMEGPLNSQLNYLIEALMNNKRNYSRSFETFRAPGFN